jgi:phenylalanyl-tRNA synthetase beta chain
MKISLNWIKDFVPLDSKIKPQELADLVTTRTAEVEGVEDLSEGFGNVVVGRIKTIKPHPDADKLQVTDTAIGPGKIVQIVCGASNIYEGMYAPVALAGAMVKWHGEGEPVELKPAKVRGVLSEAMLCAGEEIGLESEEYGIYDLKPFDVKEGMPLSKVFSKNDIVFEVDNKSLTHRPDLWGHYGMAREIAAITGKQLKKLDLKVKFPLKGESPDIQIKDYDLCPRYCGVIINNIKVEDSPQWMKDRLIAVGYRPISNIVDVTNYVMAELGQPLHAFDKNYIKKGIVVRRAEKDEKITTLDGQKRKLDTDTLVIADHEKPVAIAGVMGSENSEINDGTTEIIIESANFNAESIRKTSTRLGLRTEAVQRFEKSLDPVLAETAIKRTCELILQLCPGAEIAGPITDAKKGLFKEITVDLDVKKVSSKIGVKVSMKECVDILKALEFGVVKKSENILKVAVPSFRATKDIDIEDDLVEEIVRMYGYENIKPTLPDLPIKVPMQNKERTLKHKARKLLAYGFGLTEVYNYAFYSQEEIDKTLMGDFEKQHIKVENPLSQDQTHMRASLIPNLLKNIAANLRFFNELKIFEVGRTYLEEGNYFPKEEKWITAAIVVKGKDKREVFYEAKSILLGFLQKFLKRDVAIVKGEKITPYSHPSRSAHIKIDGKLIEGGIFEVHPKALKNWGIEANVAMFELNFTALCKLDEKITKYVQLSKFPGLDIDVSVVIDRRRAIGEVEKAIQNADKDLITNIKLFDRYEGENIDEDKKALAFRVLLQAADRTLTDEEMGKVQKKIFANLQKLGGTIRGI